MTRLSEYLLPTEKQAPAEAEATSHKLLVRAGLIRQLGAGLWTFLPAGWKVHQKAVQIVREELNAIGAMEMLMPVLHPAELWRRSGRYGIDELFKLTDRKGADMVLAMTHEENITFHMASIVRSYRDLPRLLYHFQTKERDEPRPRAGLLRTREFIMKDSYSFDRDAAGLDVSYRKHIAAYDRIFDRAGLEWYRVESDVGMMGGTDAHEYMAPCAAGEDEVALAAGYAANVEVARADARPAELSGLSGRLETPGARTIDELASQLGVSASGLLKAFPVVAGEDRMLVLLRGDHRLNETKLTNHLGREWRPASEDEIDFGPAGFLGPVGSDWPVLLDEAVAPGAYVTGGNEPDIHVTAEPGSDFACERADLRRVEAGDTWQGQAIRVEPAIEIANIFKLGTRYSEPLGANYLDESGAERPIWMGSYGIGPARIMAAAIEQFADEQGISWPRSLAPFDAHLVAASKAGTEERALADRVYDELLAAGLDVLYDDRDGSPGAKFADAELLGCPLRLTVGRRTAEAGEVEAQVRRGRESRSLPLEGTGEAAAELWRGLA
jgi:prolyl-tRNA synthetase